VNPLSDTVARGRIRWGVLSTAKIATRQVIPAMQQGVLTEILAIASRDEDKAIAAAKELGIPRAYGSYEDLLSDPDVEAIYNPLPNHLHVSWTLKALEAGKHVLCEKPLGLDASDAARILGVIGTPPRFKVMEAFMYRFHPQWQKALSLVQSLALGEVRAISSFFSYYNAQPENIRNHPDMGGGGLMDIGCYCISWPRFLLGDEPVRVVGLSAHDPVLGVDRLASGILEFPGEVQVTFTCSTQMVPYQRVQVLGTKGRLEMEIPANAPAGEATRLLLFSGKGVREEPEVIAIEPSNQYTLQGDAFSRAILEDLPVPTPLTDAVANMAVIDALVRSGKEGRWVEL